MKPMKIKTDERPKRKSTPEWKRRRRQLDAKTFPDRPLKDLDNLTLWSVTIEWDRRERHSSTDWCGPAAFKVRKALGEFGCHQIIIHAVADELKRRNLLWNGYQGTDYWGQYEFVGKPIPKQIADDMDPTGERRKHWNIPVAEE